jgi:hypothetical protein
MKGVLVRLLTVLSIASVEVRRAPRNNALNLRFLLPS